MISQAAATVIPIAHPITPPKFATIRKSHKNDFLWVENRIKL